MEESEAEKLFKVFSKRFLQIHSFSHEIYTRFSDTAENQNLEDFLTEERELTKFEDGVEKKIRISILGNINPDYKDSGVELGEIAELLKFAHLYGIVGHSGHKRDSGVDYYAHPKSATIILSKYQASYKGLVAMMLHDMVEERAREEIGGVDENRGLKMKAMFYSIGLELYNFVRNNSKINNKEEFYKSINSIMKIIGNMTRVDRRYTYIDYLRYQIFYSGPVDPRKNRLPLATPDNLSVFLGEFEGVESKSSLIYNFMEDVFYRDPTGKMPSDEPSKTKRRTIMVKLADMTHNITDMDHKPLSFRMWEYFKGIVITHEAGVKQQKLDETGYFGKIMDQCAELRATILTEINKDLVKLENGGQIEQDYMGFAKHFIVKYRKIKKRHDVITAPNEKEGIALAFEAYLRKINTGRRIQKEHYEKGNPFDGTFIKYIDMLMYRGHGDIDHMSDKEKYVGLLLFKDHIEHANEIYINTKKQPTVKKFGLEHLAKHYDTMKKELGLNNKK